MLAAVGWSCQEATETVHFLSVSVVLQGQVIKMDKEMPRQILAIQSLM